jgi:hypothetical protein
MVIYQKILKNFFFVNEILHKGGESVGEKKEGTTIFSTKEI